VAPLDLGAAPERSQLRNTSLPEEEKKMMRTVSRLFLLAALLTLSLTRADAQVVSLDPGYSASVLTCGLSAPSNGLIYRRPTDDLLVVERSGNRVTRVDVTTGAKNTFATVSSPSYMAINSTGDVYVNPGDLGSSVSRFSSTGTFLGSFLAAGFPEGIAFDSADNFYVADNITGNIYKYAAGAFVSPSVFAGGFSAYLGMAISPVGRVFIGEFNRASFFEVTPGGTTISSHILWAGGIAQPSNIAFDPISGSVFVTTGSSVLRLLSPGVATTFATGFTSNVDLDFDAHGNLYVDDSETGQIWKFTKVFDVCIQDESNGNLLQINSSTGDYQFTNCGGLTLGGSGSIIKRGGTITLQHYAADRVVLAKVDTAVNKATASLRFLPTGMTFTITDRNTTNNTCGCAF